MGRIVRFKRDLRYRLRRWQTFGAVLFLGLLVAAGIGAYSQFATTESGSVALPQILRPRVSSQPIVGQASVVDGDSIEIHGTRIRLFGIDAPEGGQTCMVQGKAMPCGQRAAFALADKIGRQVVECRPKDEDRYGRVVAVCGVGGEDINAWMVAQGWALAYRYYSRDYVSQERSASKARLGMWQGEFEPPWDWRHKNPQPPTQRPGQPIKLVEPPAVIGEKDFAGANKDCAIKGNISARGRFYHMPGDESYAKTGINLAKGERWFCTEAEAQAAGWRRARR